jgi:hypothetical protein
MTLGDATERCGDAALQYRRVLGADAAPGARAGSWDRKMSTRRIARIKAEGPFS